MTGLCTRCGFEIENDAETITTCPRCGDEQKAAAVLRIKGTREDSPDFVPFPERSADPFTERRREQDIRMMKSPQHWPSHVLAMKRYRPGIEVMTMDYAVWDGTTLLVNALVFAGKIIKQPTEQIVATPEEIVAQGWTVD